MMHNASINIQNKGSHHTVYKAASLASLGDGREDDFYLWKLPMAVLQVLLYSRNKLHTLDVSEVVSTTLNQEDIWHSSSSKAPMEEGEEFSSNHASPFKPVDSGIKTKVGPDCLPFFPTVNVAVPNDVYSVPC